MLATSNHHLLIALEDFEAQLIKNPLRRQVLERLKKINASNVKITKYKEAHNKRFKELNYEWIAKNFTIEKSDQFVLSNPDKAIIEKGGFIFFSQSDNVLVGTMAMIKIDNVNFEIAKMAVTETWQNKEVGQKLLDHAIETAIRMKLKGLIHYSNTLLASAINLYFKNGFRVIPKTDFHNSRANIKMQRTFDADQASNTSCC